MSSRNIKNASADMRADMAAIVGAGAAHFRDELFAGADGLGEVFDAQLPHSMMSSLTEPLLIQQHRDRAKSSASGDDKGKDKDPARDPQKFVDVASLRNRAHGRLVMSLCQAKDKVREALDAASKSKTDADTEDASQGLSDKLYVAELEKTY